MRADCGGCHANSVETLAFETTETGKRAAIGGATAGIPDDDPHIQNGMWDLTTGTTPLLTQSGVSFEPGYSYGVEFNRPVLSLAAQAMKDHRE